MVGELKDDTVREYEIHPEDYGFSMSSHRNIQANSSQESAELIKQALDNKAGTARDIVAFNAGLAIYAGQGADSIAQGIQIAKETLESGAARAKLEEFCALTRKLTK